MTWTKESFAALRLKTDPLADNVIKDIISSGDTQAINKLFTQLRENDDVTEIEFPDSVKNYFEESSKLPEWVDWEKVKIGQKVFASYGPEISLCLLCKSLPEAYACANGAQVLYRTGRMTEQNGSLEVFTRRLMETAQFVINVCTPGGLEPKGKGIQTAQKVRLIHASIRYYIKQFNWPEEYGEPINQQDMAGTLQSFSTLIIQGLGQLKIELTEEEKEGYYHCWRVVGHVIGLEPELNVDGYKNGLALGESILADQMAPSKAGEELTQAVCAFLEEMLPGNIFKHAPEAIIRYLIGDKMAECLSLEEESNLIDKLLPRLMGFAFDMADELQDQRKVLDKIISTVNMHLLQGMLNHFNENKQVRFDIPPNLKDDWGLSYNTSMMRKPRTR